MIHTVVCDSTILSFMHADKQHRTLTSCKFAHKTYLLYIGLSNKIKKISIR